MSSQPFPLEFILAQLGAVLVALAALFGFPARARVKQALFVAMVALIGGATIVAASSSAPAAFDGGVRVLHVAALIGALATAWPRPSVVTLVAVAGNVFLFSLARWIHPFVPALLAVHLAFAGLLIGLDRIADSPRESTASSALAVPLRSYARDDAVLFGVATLLCALVAAFVLERFTLSGDEWANTYQADLFAHLRLYGAPRACAGVFRNFWVFNVDGRMFAQYTPGWPLVMAPFQIFGAAWLAGSFAFGATVVGIARLARRAAIAGAFGFDDVTARGVRIAGLLAAIAAIASPALILNGASRYPHTIICACFAWATESACAATEPNGSPRARRRAGAMLGFSVALALSVRPADGATIGLGVAAYATYALARRRFRLDALVATLLAFGAWATITLVILRVQLGVWFKTGYDASDIPLRMSLPPLADLAYAFKIDKGTWWWWPCSPALATLGLLGLRGAGRRIGAMLGIGSIAMIAFYMLVEYGRDAGDSGYSPRYTLPLVVPMAVGVGLVLAPLWQRARVASMRLTHALPALAAALAIVVTAGWIAKRTYPDMYNCLHAKCATRRAIAHAGLHRAVVVVGNTNNLATHAWDLTQNLPSEPDPDVLIVTDWQVGDDMECARRTYGDRAWYGASGWDEVELRPIPAP